MVAADYGPLGRRTDEFTIEMVQVPIFGAPKGVPFPRFARVCRRVRRMSHSLNELKFLLEGLLA